MGNVLPFPSAYTPTFEELERLNSWQRAIDLWRAELSREHKLKSFTPAEIQVSKQLFAVGVRKRWQVHQGLKEAHTLIRSTPGL
jgi:hypothetical protein